MGARRWSWMCVAFAVSSLGYAVAADLTYVEVDDAFEVSHYSQKTSVRSPISLTVDEQGAVYVAEVGRVQRGVEDTRKVRFWMMDEIAIQSTDDRLKQYNKWIKAGKFEADRFTKYEDRIVKLIDTDGDGLADKKTIYADGFNKPLDGHGSSILYDKGRVYYANIPNLWLLEDTTGDGVADTRKSLQDGFGLRSGVSGHDMHGLEWGPDGRLYWSIGDRGYNIVTKEGVHLKDSESGAVFRCDPDGSNIEIFCFNNRNPQDLAFDQYGDLFTVDNNRGGIDRSRLCYLIEGGDYGWQSGFENMWTFRGDCGISSLKGPGAPIAWTDEGLWRTNFPGQGAHVIPAINYIDGGSCGIVYVPGRNLGERYENRFIFADWTLGLKAFAMRSVGAGYEMDDFHDFFKAGSLIDVDFDNKGDLLIADYSPPVASDDGTRGAVYRVRPRRSPETSESAAFEKVLAEGLASSSEEALFDLLRQRDQRVRRNAQRELVARGAKGQKWLLKAASESVALVTPAEGDGGDVFDGLLLRRIHGIWGLGQIARTDVSVVAPLVKLLDDPFFRIRAQAARTLGGLKVAAAGPRLTELLSDAHPRVRSFAAMAVGKVGYKAAVPQLGALLESNDNKDPYMRHAVVYGLEQMDDLDAVLTLAKHPAPSVRLGVLLVLRRTKDGRIARFLQDENPTLIAEAIRAIHDEGITGAELALAEHLRDYIGASSDVVLPSLLNFHRIVNVAVRLGREEDLKNILEFATESSIPEKARAMALYRLHDWSDPFMVDRVIGQVRKVPAGRYQNESLIASAIKTQLPKAEGQVLAALYFLAGDREISLGTDVVERQVLAVTAHRNERLGALKVLLNNPPESLYKTLETLLRDREESLRLAGLKALCENFPDKASPHLKRVLSKAGMSERQVAINFLGTLDIEVAPEILVDAVGRLKAGQKGMKEVELELREACGARPEASVTDAWAAYEKSLPAEQAKDAYRDVLFGGSMRRGRTLARSSGTAQCIVCHSIRGGGGVVAPDLAKMGKRASREYYLQSIVDPNAVVVPGFGSMTATLKDGSVLIGSVVAEDGKTLTLRMADQSKKVVAIADVKSRTDAVSLMPPMGSILKKREIRDIISFLVYLNVPEKKAAH